MDNREIKFIIVRDKQGRIRHFKSPILHHYDIARKNGFESNDILEAGLFLEGQEYILECILLRHLEKKQDKFIGNLLNFGGDIKLNNWLRGRALETDLYYSIKPSRARLEGD